MFFLCRKQVRNGKAPFPIISNNSLKKCHNVRRFPECPTQKEPLEFLHSSPGIGANWRNITCLFGLCTVIIVHCPFQNTNFLMWLRSHNIISCPNTESCIPELQTSSARILQGLEDSCQQLPAKGFLSRHRTRAAVLCYSAAAFGTATDDVTCQHCLRRNTVPNAVSVNLCHASVSQHRTCGCSCYNQPFARWRHSHDWPTALDRNP